MSRLNISRRPVTDSILLSAADDLPQPIDDTTDGPAFYEEFFTTFGDYADTSALTHVLRPTGLFGLGGIFDILADDVDELLRAIPVLRSLLGDEGMDLLDDALSVRDLATTLGNTLIRLPYIGTLLDGDATYDTTFPVADRDAVDRSIADRNEKYSVIMLPDTQYYTNGTVFNGSPLGTPEIFDSMTKWIVRNERYENIVFATQVGDITDNGRSKVQFDRADKAMGILDGKVPYAVLPGNHDFVDVNQYDVMDEKPGNRGAQLYLETFNADRYLDQGAEWYGGASPNGLSSYQYVQMGDVTMLHLSLEWNNLKFSLPWAKEVVERHAGMPTFISTHANIADEGGGISVVDPRANQGGRDLENGSHLWDYLVEDYDQIFMVLNGHYSRYGALDEAGEFTQISRNAAGNDVVEMLFDPQSQNYGGNGYFRQLEFQFRDGNDLIGVRTRSALEGRSEEMDANSRFKIRSIDFADTDRFGTTERQETATLVLGNSTSATLTSEGRVRDGLGAVWRDPETGGEHQTLLKFAGLNRLPDGAQIASAVLVLGNANPGDGAQLYRMDRGWNPDSTWDSLRDGVQVGAEAFAREPDAKFFDGEQALEHGALQQVDGDPFVGLYPYGWLSEWDATIAPQRERGGLAYADVTETVRAWVEDGVRNLGWAMLAPQSSGFGGLEREHVAGDDAWRFATGGENAPRLIIEFVEDAALIG